MIYADINSFLAIEVSSCLIKQLLLDAIISDKARKQPFMEEEYNVFMLSIDYINNRVEIWDTMMESIEDDQKPYTSSLDDFIDVLEKHSPNK